MAKQTSSDRLRRRLVRDLRAKGAIRSPAVRDAFLAVPREQFLSGLVAELGLEAVYRDDAIVTKRDTRGLALSSSSQPALMAEMLELLAVSPGDRVLEIGAGTGYNAALLTHLVGPNGKVTSIDIDPALARAARKTLRQGAQSSSADPRPLGRTDRPQPAAAPPAFASPEASPAPLRRTP